VLGDRLEEFERPVEIRVVARVLDQGAGMRHRRTVATECTPYGSQREAKRDMSQVHGDLPSEGNPGAAACRVIENAGFDPIDLLHRLMDRADLGVEIVVEMIKGAIWAPDRGELPLGRQRCSCWHS
jgi:hypothetical protein